MKVLITGVCGFIGSNLAKYCKNTLKWTVHGVDDLSSGKYDFLKGVRLDTFMKSDFSDSFIQNSIKFNKYDVVFHLAAMPRVSYSVEYPYETNDINVTKTLKLMTNCIGNVKRFIFTSSSAVYGDTDVFPTIETTIKNPNSPYGLQKSIIEDYCKIYSSLYGLDTVCLRPFNVFGPNQIADSAYSTAISAWCHAIKNKQSLRSDWDGNQSRDMTYVDNVVYLFGLAATSTNKFSGDCFNAGCGNSVSNNEILSYLKNRYPNISVTNKPKRPGDVFKTQADLEKSKAILGYTPQVEFWDGFERTLKWNGI